MPQREAHQAFMALLLTRRKKKARICFCEMIQETQVLEKKKKKAARPIWQSNYI